MNNRPTAHARRAAQKFWGLLAQTHKFGFWARTPKKLGSDKDPSEDVGNEVNFADTFEDSV